MLTHEENELLCRVGASTPMGRMMRRYWLPAIMSDELEREGKPKRVRLLGEDLVAYRDKNGAVGILEEACPHRGASLAIARNEECVLQCLYHGWKMDATGAVTEMPSEPEGSTFAQRIRAVAYPAREWGGLVWTFMGPGEPPPPMDFEWTKYPAPQRLIFKAITDCNWVQAMEGALDSAHTPILHGNAITPGAVTLTTYQSDLKIERPSNDTRPRLHIEDTPYGMKYAAVRTPLVDPETMQYVRVTQFIAPCYVTFPAPAGFSYMQLFVPIDDHTTMFYFAQASDRPFDPEQIEKRRFRAGFRAGIDIDEDFRRAQRRENDWLQDRVAMRDPKSGNFSGIFGVQAQDMAIQESMGPLYNRSREHLGASDAALIRMRRRLIDGVRAFERGEPALGLAERTPYGLVHSEEKLIPIDAPWQTVGALAEV